MSTFALIPAKWRSAGVPHKNWRPLTPDGKSCTDLAVLLGQSVCDRVAMTTDADMPPCFSPLMSLIHRPANLPDTMLAVVQDALKQVPGPDDEIIVLLQPSSPLRTAETVRKAIQMLGDDPAADSAVSISSSYPVEWALVVSHGYVKVWLEGYGGWREMPPRRQDCEPAYRRDGVVYTFRRKTIQVHGNIYGRLALPLYTPPDEALSIDTQADWDEAVRRLSSSVDSPAGDTSSPA